MAKFTLQVNGKPRVVEADPDTPLLWILRDELQLVGTKFGCGMGLCGACTVHLDGTPATACTTTLARVGNRKITTIEGLDPQGTHPLQQVWQELDVPQCGYCQPGQLMAAAALLAKRPHPTDAEIDEALAGNVCRCGTYPRIRAGIHRAAELARAAKVRK